MTVKEFTGTTSLTAAFRMPLSLEHCDDDEMRRVAWFGFRDLVAHTEEPPEDFVVTIA